MPVSREVVFKCRKCNYKKTYTIGDCLDPTDVLKKCPICGGMMVMGSNEDFKDLNDFLSNIIDIFRKK